MTDVALVGASCEADGHPNECTEPATGSVQSTSGCVLRVNGTDVATHDTADMHFDSHGHSTDVDNNCTNFQSHDLDPDQTHFLTVNGSPVYLVGDSTTDPGSGGTAQITDNGGNGLLDLL